MLHDPPFTAKSLAERWSVDESQVRKLCRAGSLRHFRVGTLIRIPVEAVAEFEAGAPSGERRSPEGRPHPK